MKDNTCILIVAEIVLGVFGVCAMFLHNEPMAGVCGGAMAALVAGHLNGTHKDPT